MIFVRSSYTRLTVLWRLLVLWSSWSNREFHEERGARGPVGSRASQGVNYARKQYYRTNYRTGERNSVKCRAAHYQPLPRECARDINYLGGDGQLAGFKGDHCPFSSPFLPSSLFFFFSISFFFLILFPRFSRFIANRGRSFDRDSQPIGKFFFDRGCASVIMSNNKSNQRCSCSTFAIIIEIEIERSIRVFDWINDRAGWKFYRCLNLVVVSSFKFLIEWKICRNLMNFWLIIIDRRLRLLGFSESQWFLQ